VPPLRTLVVRRTTETHRVGVEGDAACRHGVDDRRYPIDPARISGVHG
jgi:hypothetical protein